MGTLRLKQRTITVNKDGKDVKVGVLTDKDFQSFTPNVLALGDIGAASESLDVVAAVFDLEGFTDFCNQVDPQLSLPEYLNRFLQWLFDEIRKECEVTTHGSHHQMYSDMLFLAKFLGDGVLFLWNSTSIGDIAMGNIIISLEHICAKYTSKFLPGILKIVVDPPPLLRCGVARGKAFSVGNKEDYVGPCLNIASRLQKLSGLTFCCSRRGFDFSKQMTKQTAARYILKKIPIRGIGDHELVWVSGQEFKALTLEQQSVFSDP